MEKIAGVFPTTFALLRADLARLSHEFADACPPHDISRIANARQFLEFLTANRERAADWPPYLFDVAACEMACAEARAQADLKQRKAISRHGARRSVAAPASFCSAARSTFEASSRAKGTPEPTQHLSGRRLAVRRAKDLRTDPGAIRRARRARALGRARRLAGFR